MKKRALPAAVVITASLLVGCAHPIVMTPKLDEVEAVAAKKSSKSAAYYISAEDRALQVTTPGGGGDKVSYKPYFDLEYGLDRVLARRYAAVYALNDPNDKKFLADKKIAYVFRPKLVTNSRSSSAFTWPPTEFVIDMECVAHNSNGEQVWTKSVKGTGHAEFAEFKHNFSLSAERASTQLLIELQKALDTAKELQ